MQRAKYPLRVHYSTAGACCSVTAIQRKQRKGKANMETKQSAAMALLLLAMPTIARAETLPPDAPTGWERAVVAAVIIGESGGHGRKGMAAVYEVIHRRATKGGTSCHAQVVKRKQFSVLNNTTPKRLVKQMSRHREYKWVHDNLLKFVPLTSHTGTNPYNRCTHYHAASVTPYWAKGKMPYATFGGHKWYNNIR